MGGNRMKIFLQPEIRYGEDIESAEILREHLLEEMLKHWNTDEDCIEIIIKEAI
jgi:septum formation topological specificity factor MinE